MGEPWWGGRGWWGEGGGKQNVKNVLNSLHALHNSSYTKPIASLTFLIQTIRIPLYSIVKGPYVALFPRYGERLPRMWMKLVDFFLTSLLELLYSSGTLETTRNI